MNILNWIRSTYRHYTESERDRCERLKVNDPLPLLSALYKPTRSSTVITASKGTPPDEWPYLRDLLESDVLGASFLEQYGHHFILSWLQSKNPVLVDRLLESLSLNQKSADPGYWRSDDLQVRLTELVESDSADSNRRSRYADVLDLSIARWNIDSGKVEIFWKERSDAKEGPCIEICSSDTNIIVTLAAINSFDIVDGRLLIDGASSHAVDIALSTEDVDALRPLQRLVASRLARISKDRESELLRASLRNQPENSKNFSAASLAVAGGVGIVTGAIANELLDD